MHTMLILGRGLLMTPNGKLKKDFFFVSEGNPEKIQDFVLSLITGRKLEGEGTEVNFSDIQRETESSVPWKRTPKF